MVYACNLMMARSVWVNIPIRGAIAYGEFLVSRDPLYFLGRPLLDAHWLESNQEWAGVALCDSAAQYLDQDVGRLVHWDVPLKRDHVEKHWVVNWPAACLGPCIMATSLPGGEPEQCKPPDWDACFPDEDEDAQGKRRNTEAFFNANHRFGGGEMVGPEQRETVKHWREMYAESRLHGFRPLHGAG